MHSLEGGTGGGFGSRIISDITAEMKHCVSTYSVLPQFTNRYNTILSLHNLIEFADVVNMIDHNALTNISNGPETYQDLNIIASQMMMGSTQSIRHPCNVNSTIQEIQHNLIPFPRIKFLMVN